MLSTPTLWASVDVAIDPAITEEQCSRSQKPGSQGQVHIRLVLRLIYCLRSTRTPLVDWQLGFLLPFLNTWTDGKWDIEVMDLPIPSPRFSDGLTADTLKSIDIASPGPLCQLLVTALNLMTTAIPGRF